MSKLYFLLILIPYSACLFWGLRKHQLDSVFGVFACVFTSLLVWLLLYLAFAYKAHGVDAIAPFQSVEEIMRDNGSWKLRYLVQQIGYIAGIVYFFSCWFIVKKFVSNKKA